MVTTLVAELKLPSISSSALDLQQSLRGIADAHRSLIIMSLLNGILKRDHQGCLEIN